MAADKVRFMRRTLGIGGLCIAGCCASFGQAQAPMLTFEVASVKPGVLRGRSTCGYRMEGGPGTSDPGRIAYHDISLSTLVKLAYLGNIHACESYVLSAPKWLDSEGFDIVAKLPPGTTWPQLGIMLQNLLAERFQLAIHREEKVISAYSLVIGKDGPKFKESVGHPAGGANDSPAAPHKATTDAEGFPVPAPSGSWIITRNGHTRMQQLNIDMATFARQLRNQLGRPVTDATGLKGTYDFTLSWVADSPVTPDSDPAPDLFTAVQQQLGLRLEASKVTIDVIVADHAEKSPSEN
jgi:uncharacterized protein (TIGR03435 family)